ncbi:MAG: DUF4292 domain-containing protein [Desulfuromonadales bacterium]|nr:DUF4292 domain-containing protein [Desulfuromonadales bacterium]
MSRLFIGLLLVVVTACARPPQVTWTELPTVEFLLTSLADTTGQVHSLDSTAKVSMTVKGKFFSSQQFLLVEKPDRLRADVLTGFGQLILQLTADGQELSVFMHTTVPGRFLRGPATAENLARFTRVPLATEDMVRLLLYEPPLITYQQAEVSAEGNTLLLRLNNQKFRQELLFDRYLRFVGCRYFSQEGIFLEVLYDKFNERDAFPQKIQIKLAEEDTKVVFKFSDLQTNVRIEPERFTLEIPAQITVEPIL